MKDTDPILREIESLEKWFRSVCLPACEANRDAIRRRVHITIEEERLAEALASEAPPELVVRAKARVHAALREQIIRPGSRTLKLAWWLGGGLSAAAMVGLAVVGLRSPSPSAETDVSASLVLAFEEFDEDEFDTELRDALSDADAFLEGNGEWLNGSDDEESLQ